MTAFFDADVEVHRPTMTVRAAIVAGAGETVALLGPNGAGKSTVLEAVAGVLAPVRATIWLDGTRIDGLPPERRPIGVSFQGGALFPTMSVLDNVAFGLRAHGVPKSQAHRRARTLLADVATVDPGADPRSLSGGQAQRVALARALAAEPRLVLLDEPLAAVDVSARVELRALVRRVTSGFDGVCVIVVHDPIDALTLADRIVVLEGGVVTQSGAPHELRERPATSYVADLVGVNLLVGTIERLENGAVRLDTADGGRVIVATSERDPELGAGMATVAPSDVALHLHEPEGSPRNVFRGPIEEVAFVGDRARVRLATRPPLVAEVTRGSVERLELRPGLEIYASFKAVEVRVVRSAPVP